MAAAATEIAGGVLDDHRHRRPGLPARGGGRDVGRRRPQPRGRPDGAAATASSCRSPTLTLALTPGRGLPGKYKLGPSLPGKLAAFGALGRGAAAGVLIAKMVTEQARRGRPRPPGLGPRRPLDAAEPMKHPQISLRLSGPWMNGQVAELDLDAYLRRIGYSGPLDVNEATLTALYRGHLARGPASRTSTSSSLAGSAWRWPTSRRRSSSAAAAATATSRRSCSARCLNGSASGGPAAGPGRPGRRPGQAAHPPDDPGAGRDRGLAGRRRLRLLPAGPAVPAPVPFRRPAGDRRLDLRGRPRRRQWRPGLEAARVPGGRVGHPAPLG